MGKHKPTYNYYDDQGDKVVITHSSKIRVTGKKLLNKIKFTHSSYPGGIKAKTLGERLASDSGRVIREAISLMLPDNRLRSVYLSRLVVYEDDEPNREGDKKDGQ